MRLLFISNYFPPEVNAPATRLIEHARQWVEDGHDVSVMTSIPNFPEGKVYDGFENRYQEETVDGIDVYRVPMYVAENKGTLKRTLSYVSFMLSCILYSFKVRNRHDVIVATSPQFFAAIGGYVVALLKRAPFVLEIRDLWPESVVAVGAAKRSLVIRFFEKLEVFLYRKADHIVVVTNAFKENISGKGIAPEKISVIKNGFDLRSLETTLDPSTLDAMRRKFGLEGKFVASYIGTIGMAHGVEVLLEAAKQSTDPDIVFMVVGTGAERDRLERLQGELKLPNFRLIDKQPKEMVPYLLQLSDVSVVHLKDAPVFRTVIPSKIFEAMAMKRPIVLGVRGETEEIILEAGAGIPITPESPAEMLDSIVRLKGAPDLYAEMAECGARYVHEHHDRKLLARRYWALIEEVAGLSASETGATGKAARIRAAPRRAYKAPIAERI